MGSRRLIGLIVSGTVLLPLYLFSQQRGASRLRVNSDLVLVPVTVSDPHDHPVTGLTKESFRLFDDGVQQTISHFSLDDAPITVGMVFDTSGSMRFGLERSRMAAAALMLTGNPQDEYFLVDFANSAQLSVPPTRNIQEIEDRISQIRPAGHTALLDGIYLALNQAKKSRLGRRALLIVSDGGDNASRYTRSEVERLLRESDVPIYAIGVFSQHSHRPVEESDGPGLLRKLAESSGGRMIPVNDTTEIPYMAVKLGMEMRTRYVLGYSPGEIRCNGRYHKLRVELLAPSGLRPLRASWRSGYYAPSE
jgi:Ca-activated chloride channel family protein